MVLKGIDKTDTNTFFTIVQEEKETEEEHDLNAEKQIAPRNWLPWGLCVWCKGNKMGGLRLVIRRRNQSCRKK